MKDINVFIKESNNQITGIKKVVWNISPNDVHYLGVSKDAVGKNPSITPVKILLKKMKPDEITEIFKEYTLENGYCVDTIRCCDARDFGGERFWELSTGLLGYRAWSEENQSFLYKYYDHGKWKTRENDTMFGKNPVELHKFFNSKYYGPLVIFKIKDYEDLPNRI